MAAEGETRDDIQAHVKSYSAFASMVKLGAMISAVVAIFVVIIIAS